MKPLAALVDAMLDLNTKLSLMGLDHLDLLARR